MGTTVRTATPDIKDLPAPLAVGDVHVENFGTWRDAEARLVWDINDHDDAAGIRYASDILSSPPAAAPTYCG
jgi:uncharacterized protein (DUF2252 family)